MTIALRQICLVANELEPVLDDLTHVLGIERCYVDEAVAHFGLENTLMTVGNNFLEVVAPVQDNTAAGRYLERRGGDGGYMVICQAGSLDEQQAVKARAAANEVRIAYEADREHWNICQFHPRDMMAAFLEVDWDQHCDFDGNWMPAGGTGWESTVTRGIEYAGAELQADDPAALAERWSAVIGTPVETRDGTPTVALGNATLRFVETTDGRGAGLGGLDLRVASADDILTRAAARGCRTQGNCVEICGTRFYLIPA